MQQMELLDPPHSPVAAPTREQVDRLEREMAALPQLTTCETSHFFVPGMYCRRVTCEKGGLIVGKVHKVPHFFMCVAGEMLAWSENGVRHLKAGDVIECQPGTKRVALALTDNIAVTVHKTDHTDLNLIEEEIVESSDAALFDIHNQLKSNAAEMQALMSSGVLK